MTILLVYCGLSCAQREQDFDTLQSFFRLKSPQNNKGRKFVIIIICLRNNKTMIKKKTSPNKVYWENLSDLSFYAEYL